MRYLLLLVLLAPSFAFAGDDDYDYEAARQMRKQMRDAEDAQAMQEAQIQDMQNTLDDMAAAQKKEYKAEQQARDNDDFERNINSINKSIHIGVKDD